MANNNRQSRAKLMRKVQQHGFAMLEAALYLDGHPQNRRALEYFYKQRSELAQVSAEYEEKFGPLTKLSADGCNGWQWVQGPWPWESEAN